MDIETTFIKETVFNIYNLEQLFEHMKAESLYTGPRALINTAIEICKLIRESFNIGISKTKGIEEADVIGFCVRYQSKLYKLHNTIIALLEGTNSIYYYPNDLILPIERLVKELMPREDNYAITLRARSQESYDLQIFQDLVDSYIHDLKPYQPLFSLHQKVVPRWLIFFSFPKLYGNDPLLHTITASHEIQHIFNHFKKISENVIKECPEIDPGTTKFLVHKLQKELLVPTRKPSQTRKKPKIVAATYGDYFKEDELYRYVSSCCTEILNDWTSEIVSDLLATRVFGPSYLFAAARQSLSLNVMDRYSDSHPSSRLRLQLMLEELQFLGYPGHHEKVGLLSSELMKWEGFISTDVKTKISPYQYAVQQHIVNDHFKKVLHDKVSNSTKGQEYTAEIFNGEVWDLVELLRLGVPPAGVSGLDEPNTSPASLPSILNAGWIFYFNYRDELGKSLKVREEDADCQFIAKTNDLLLKAIELSEFCQILKDTKGYYSKQK